MSIEDYLKSLEHGSSHGEGEFSLDAARARRLLSERTLEDTWQAWLCLVQGLLNLKARRIDIVLESQLVTLRCQFLERPTSEQLFADDRFLLGWLNLEWFGTPSWSREMSLLSVSLKGSVWGRYRMTANLKTLFQNALSYLPIPCTVAGKSPALTQLPRNLGCTFYPHAKPEAFSLPLAHLLGTTPGRTHWLCEQPAEKPEGLAALAFRNRLSWSQATWVSKGVVINEERNTLERPGLWLVASVDSLGLETDLSGFKVIHNEAYFQFINRLKKEVLWMM